MPDANLERRVAILEENMKQFEDVPARLTAVESHILRLRGEMQLAFSAVRTEIRSGFSAVRTEMRALHEEVISRIALIQERPSGKPAGRVVRQKKR